MFYQHDKHELTVVNLIGMEYNQVFLPNSSFLENALVDFAQNFTNEKQNPTKYDY